MEVIGQVEEEEEQVDWAFTLTYTSGLDSLLSDIRRPPVQIL